MQQEYLIVTKYIYSSNMTFFEKQSGRFLHFFFFKHHSVRVPAECESGSSFLPSKHATIHVNVCEGGTEQESEETREWCTRGSCVIWPHFKMDLWGCREGSGVAFTATFSSLPPKWQDGRAHTKARVRRLPGNHPHGDERAPVKSWCKNATRRNACAPSLNNGL